jgi:putative SOS response-associated peptidase YedK
LKHRLRTALHDLATAGKPHLKALLAPYPSEAMICWPVSPRVGNVRNNDSSLIEPVAAA